MRYINYNPNPKNARVGDCVIRAVSCATNKSWIYTYIYLCIYGLMCFDLLSSNAVWGRYLHDKGFKKYLIPYSCPDGCTVEQFAKQHQKGTYILALNGHVVCVKDGRYYDTWDSGNEVAIYYWKKE